MVKPTQQTIDAVMAALRKRDARLVSLSMALTNQMAPANEEADCDDPVAWNLAEVLEEQIVNIDYMGAIRAILMEVTHGQ